LVCYWIRKRQTRVICYLSHVSVACMRYYSFPNLMWITCKERVLWILIASHRKNYWCSWKLKLTIPLSPWSAIEYTSAKRESYATWVTWVLLVCGIILLSLSKSLWLGNLRCLGLYVTNHRKTMPLPLSTRRIAELWIHWIIYKYFHNRCETTRGSTCSYNKDLKGCRMLSMTYLSEI
jgi:hypothetical protein